MIVAGIYSFKNGKNVIEYQFQALLQEILKIIQSIHPQRKKISQEKTMTGKLLFSPIQINQAFKTQFQHKSWKTCRIQCEYSQDYYTQEYQMKNPSKNQTAFREMDFIKDSLGVEVQFGKYSFMVYNVCAKMTIFNRLGYIKAGVEIVPVKNMAQYMSTGVSYFEQFVWDLDHRGISDIDIPVLILGVDF